MLRKLRRPDEAPGARVLLLSIKWMDWGEIAWYDKEAIEKDWQVYRDGLILTREHYQHREDIDLPERRLSPKALKRLERFLNFFFCSTKDNFNCDDGEGWEIIYYGTDGRPLHTFNGYAYGSLILGHIIKLICGKKQSGY